MIQFLLIFNFARADINWPFTSCPGSPYVPKIVTLSAPPARNVNIIFKVIGISQQSISVKHATLQVKLNGIHLDSIEIPYQQVYDQGDKTLFSYTRFIPSFSPSGAYTLHFTIKSIEEKDLGCIEIQFKL